MKTSFDEDAVIAVVRLGERNGPQQQDQSDTTGLTPIPKAVCLMIMQIFSPKTQTIM